MTIPCVWRRFAGPFPAPEELSPGALDALGHPITMRASAAVEYERCYVHPNGQRPYHTAERYCVVDWDTGRVTR